MIQKIKSLWDQLQSKIKNQEPKTKNTPFYWDWVGADRLYHLIAQLHLTDQQREEILALALETLHLEMLEATLSLVPEQHHKTVIENIHLKPHALFAPYDVSVEIIETHLKKVGERSIENIQRTILIH